ncbi:MAG: hypothetical protein JXA54_09685 [Candidatus Heimdallarchaeota archaeon]|nr:hypothetical protein [Candidatus Heimdallarchaeota archaeon]
MNKKEIVDFIQNKINETSDYLVVNKYPPVILHTQELQAYFEGEAPSGDSITLDMVLQSKWLIIHELIEITELKKQGFTISSELLLKCPEEVFNAHLIATEWELDLATKEGDHKWVQQRLKDIQNWLEDPSLKIEFFARCMKLLKKYKH